MYLATTLRRWRQLLALSLFTLLAVAPAGADPADPAGRVGRIAWLSGSVHLHQAASGQSSSAVLNWPLTSGDVLSTGAGARAEVQIGSIRLQVDSGSVIELVQVDDQRIRLHLLDGSVIARLPSPEAAHEFEFDTRDGRFLVRDAGRYRFDCDRSATAATVYAGSLRFDATDSSLDIGAGQRVRFWNAGRTQYQLSPPVNDQFAVWSAARERQYSATAPAGYVSAEMTGAADLEAYGSWQESPEYGAVWFPRALAADWAPYRTGRWVWVEPWGWNWVGDEPWGFAPFHYGRWVLYRGAWGWVPGQWVARPVYAPALVAWIGAPGVAGSVSVGARPAVGWFPLAPREVYIPPYRSSPGHLRQVNSTQVTNINNLTEISNNPQAAADRMRYAHQRLPQALTAVPAEVLTERRHVGEAAIPYPERTLLGSQPVQVQAPVALPPASPARTPAAARALPVPAALPPASPLPTLPSAVRAAGSERPVAEAPRLQPRPDRPEQRALPAALPPQAPLAAAQRFERPPAEVVRPPVVLRQERPEQRISVPAPAPAQVPAPLPQALAAPRAAERPAAVPLPTQPRPESLDRRADPRRQERTGNRDEMVRPQGRQEPRVDPASSLIPQRAPTAPERVDSPAAAERRPERSQ